MKNISILLISGLFLLTSCQPEVVEIYNGSADNCKATLTGYEKPNFDTQEQWLELKINNLPTINIRPGEIRPFSRPVDTTVLTARHIAVINESKDTATIGNFTNPKLNCAIYLDPAVFTEADFEAAAKCLQAIQPAMEKALYTKYLTGARHYNFPHFSYLVFGIYDKK